MNLVKLAELKITNNDVYLLEAISKQVVINDNYEGILVLNEFFNVIKTIKIFDDIMIERCYKQFSNNSILLYCYENSCLVNVNLKHEKFSIIQIKEGDGMFFSPLYWWKSDDEVILTTYKKELFKLFCKKNILSKISEDYLKKSDPQFYRIWNSYKDISIVHFFPEESVLLTTDDDASQLIVYDYKSTTEKRISYYLKDTHDFVYKDGTTILIHEDQVDVLRSFSRGTLKTKNFYIFTVAQFFDSKRFITLKNNQARYRENMLTLYQMQE